MKVSTLITTFSLLLVSSLAAANFPENQIVSVTKDDQTIEYLVSNENASTEEFQALTEKEKKVFYQTRLTYLTAAAKILSQKSVGFLLTRPAWFKKFKDAKYGFDFQPANEQTMVQMIDDEKILSGNWPEGAVANEKERLHAETLYDTTTRYLNLIDQTLWKDAKNLSDYNATGVIAIGEIQTGGTIMGRLLYVGGGFAIEVTKNDLTEKLKVRLSLNGEKNFKEGNKTLAFHILNLRVAGGFQSKKDNGKTVQGGEGWYLPVSPVYLQYNGDRLASLGYFGVDIGMLTMLAALKKTKLTDLIAHIPVLGFAFNSATELWTNHLSPSQLHFLVPIVTGAQWLHSAQIKWKTFKLLEFSIGYGENAPLTRFQRKATAMLEKVKSWVGPKPGEKKNEDFCSLNLDI